MRAITYFCFYFLKINFKYIYNKNKFQYERKKKLRKFSNVTAGNYLWKQITWYLKYKNYFLKTVAF